jgi:hypothetical protein
MASEAQLVMYHYIDGKVDWLPEYRPVQSMMKVRLTATQYSDLFEKFLGRTIVEYTVYSDFTTWFRAKFGRELYDEKMGFYYLADGDGDAIQFRLAHL